MTATTTATTNDKPFRLLRSDTMPLTRELAAKFQAMEASPTERDLDPSRVKALRSKIEAGLGVNFLWATAKLGDKVLRMNGQHSSLMLTQLNGGFPEDLRVHLDEYEVSDREGLAVLFRQFDDRMSGRKPKDVAGAWQKLYKELEVVPKATAQLGIHGITWHAKNIAGGKGVPTDDGRYSWFNKPELHPFLIWLGELFSVKTQEMEKPPIVGAMYATWQLNEEEAKKFWASVAAGGGYGEGDPATVLDDWFKSQMPRHKDPAKKLPTQKELYNGCSWAWNAFREEKPIKDIKFDRPRPLTR